MPRSRLGRAFGVFTATSAILAVPVLTPQTALTDGSQDWEPVR
ncbi:hypothetical protein [Streptomyces zaehneri]|nr:hypothetical protein [Streptomyces sp. DSM 40713]